MPVNMDPAKRRRRTPKPADSPAVQPAAETQPKEQAPFGAETEEDRLKALADAERKNLWDATEVIDMDTF